MNLNERYKKLKKDYPEAKLALDVIPGVGVATSAADMLSKLADEDYEGAASEAVGLIPGMKAGVVLSKAAKAVLLKKQLNAIRGTAKVVDAAGDAGSYQEAVGRYAKGGKVTGYKGYGKARKC